MPYHMYMCTGSISTKIGLSTIWDKAIKLFLILMPNTGQ